MTQGAAGTAALARTSVDLPLPRVRSGKVREVFEAGDALLLVATDRISAFDVVFAEGIPGKGRVLTGVSRFWFDGIDRGEAGLPRLAHHLLSCDAGEVLSAAGLASRFRDAVEGRSMLVRRAVPIPFECVVRGYLDGSGLAEYRATGRLAGEPLPPGLRRGDRLRRPAFTPARKALTGHDENVTFDEVARTLGGPLAETLRDRSLLLYSAAAAALAARGLLLADTKFEFGLPVGTEGPPAAEEPLLIDEVLTPDSSRLWDAESWEPGVWDDYYVYESETYPCYPY